MVEITRWPAPLLQTDKKKDCLLYSTAYLCHCLGFPEVTVEQIRQYRAETGWYEASFPSERLSVRAEHWWHYKLDRVAIYQRFWMGAAQRGWVEQHLVAQQIALASIHRVPEMGHIVVLLEAGETSVLLADPIHGHVRETWEWFLSTGPGGDLCHRIEGWYSRSES